MTTDTIDLDDIPTCYHCGAPTYDIRWYGRWVKYMGLCPVYHTWHESIEDYMAMGARL